MLEINKLQKKYENFELNCSMKVEKGYITALVGENGAGKSTTFKALAELMKERRRLYRNGGRETGEERLSEINEELKRLRKEVRMTVQIEKHSLEIEAKLQKAEEQSQNEKRVEDKERMQKSQEVR